VRPNPRETSVGVLARDLELHVLVEQLEAFLARDLRARRAEQPSDQLSMSVISGHVCLLKR
jgi:hypothetical protein